MIFTIPNDASDEIVNEEFINGNIALIERGKISLAEKIQRVQDIGAKGVIIIDNGECDDNFHCGVLGNKESGDGFGKNDMWELWHNIEIPSVLITKSSGEKIKSTMNLVKSNISPYGQQYYDKNMYSYFEDEL